MTGRRSSCGKLVLKEGDLDFLNGSTRRTVYEGQIETQAPKLTGPFA